MFRRPALTILFVTDRDVVRADFSVGKRPKLTEWWRRERAIEGNLATAVELAVGMGGKVGRRVLLLTTAAWTQTILVHGASVQGLGQDELSQTLKFEVESFSGMNAFDAELGYVELSQRGEDREFWVTELDRSELSFIADIVAARGGKLAGVCHPAGLPAGLLDAGAWRRLEFWQDLVCCLEAGMGARRLFIANTDPRSDRWEVGLRNWQQQRGAGAESTAAAQSLVAPGVGVPGEHLDEVPLRLDDQEVLERWLAAWAGCWAGGQSAFPLLRPPAKVTSPRTYATRAVVTAATVLAACIAHGSYVGCSTKWFSRQIDELSKPAEQIKELNKQLAEIEKEQTELEAQQQELAQEVQEVEAITVERRGRIAKLLKLLAEARHGDVVVTRLTHNQTGIEISGTSLATDGATRFASALRPSLLRLGWEVAPPTQDGTDQLLNGGPWTFSIQLVDAPPAADVQTVDGQVAKTDSK